MQLLNGEENAESGIEKKVEGRKKKRVKLAMKMHKGKDQMIFRMLDSDVASLEAKGLRQGSPETSPELDLAPNPVPSHDGH